MSTTTPTLSLTLYDSTTDQSVTFATFRAVWGGTATTSNFYKIDTWAGTVNSSLTTLQNQRGAITVSGTYVSANYYEAVVPSISSYITGMTILLKLDTDSNGTVTLNINSLGTKTVSKINTSGTVVNITGSELQAGRYNHFVYDGTQWIWVNAGTTESQVYASGTSGNIVTVDSNNMMQSSLTPWTLYGGISPSGGTVYNGRISVSVSSNNITLALKTYSGGNPSSTDPVYAWIGGTLRTITSSLSVTKNAGTNWFNSGSSELATNEIDYFAYLGYNSSDGVTIGFARIPYAETYGDFSTTNTNARYCAISTITNASSTDSYTVIGRFAATLSASASYNWSVPTYTSSNLINRPIYYTRTLTYTPTLAWTAGADPSGAVGTSLNNYKISNGTMDIIVSRLQYATAGTTVTALTCTLPMALSSQYQTCAVHLTNSGVPIATNGYATTTQVALICSSSTVNRLFIQGTMIIQ